MGDHRSNDRGEGVGMALAPCRAITAEAMISLLLQNYSRQGKTEGREEKEGTEGRGSHDW